MESQICVHPRQFAAPSEFNSHGWRGNPTDKRLGAITCGLILTLGSSILWRPKIVLDDRLFGEQRRRIVEGTLNWKIYRAGRWAMDQSWYRPLNFVAGLPFLWFGLRLLGWL